MPQLQQTRCEQVVSFWIRKQEAGSVLERFWGTARSKDTHVRRRAIHLISLWLGSAWNHSELKSTRCQIQVNCLSKMSFSLRSISSPSTPGILTLLHARARKLTYPRFALDSLRSLLIPNPNRVNITPLADAFTVTRAETLRPWPQMHDCPNRAILDQAAAQVLRVDGRTIADWRERIAREPTVSGKLKGKAPLFCGEAGNARI